MNVVGENGVIEMNMFAQSLDVYSEDKHSLAGYGSNIDHNMVAAFVDCVVNNTAPPVTGWDGVQAARVALAGYESVKKGEPVAVRS